MEKSKLAELVTAFLPFADLYKIHHVSHPPSKSEALYSPPLNNPPTPTTLTSHLLSVSLSSTDVLFYAIEVLIYSTSHTTTLFVSKADSTGLLPRRNPSAINTTSPIRTITTAFLQHLLESTWNAAKTSHISLFARAQDQYLFPNSIRNKDKHVLNDRQLIKWWARCLDPILQSQLNQHRDVKGYVLVPGLDKYESRSLMPTGKGWVYSHPCMDETKPVRECIPQFPDDPKSRFMMELEVDGGSGWKGVRTLGSFWEQMEFRQECSLGKSVGFINLIIPAVAPENVDVLVDSQETAKTSSRDSQRQEESTQASIAPDLAKKRKPTPRLSQTMSTYTVAHLLKSSNALQLKARAQLKRQNAVITKGQEVNLPSSPAGGKVVSKKDYDRLMASLMDSDFGGRKLAEDSSKKWIANLPGEELLPYTGSVEQRIGKGIPERTTVHMLSPRKRKSEEILADKFSSQVNVLSTDVAMKKPQAEETQPVVTILQPRKKPKPEIEEHLEPPESILQPRKKVILELVP